MKWVVLFGLLAAAGCQTSAPQVPTIQVNADSATFTNALLAKRGTAGYTIISQTPNVLVLEKTELHDVGAIFVAGGNGPPRYRLTYQMFGSNPLNVQVSGVLVESAGTAFEKPYPHGADKIVTAAREEVGAIAAGLKQS